MSRIVLLGAGFSKAAGLPLGDELFKMIRAEARTLGLEHILEEDINLFARYESSRTGCKVDIDKIKLEKFISYLDIEHYLGLRGPDTWSSDGNKSQMLIRNLICKVLFEKQNAMTEATKALYDAFVRKLNPDDWVITFNYDTILENALYRNGIEYRLYPAKYETDDTINNEASEVVLLKMHGSMNWFDITKYNKSFAYMQKQLHYYNPRHTVFGDSQLLKPTKIAHHARETSPLQSIYAVKDIDRYLIQRDYLCCAPLIISPSYSKMVYFNPLLEFWEGFYKAGLYNTEIVIIGFSLPEHDEYISIPLINMIVNFQQHNHIEALGGQPRKNLKIVDYQQTTEDITQFKKRFCFVDWGQCDIYWDGLTEDVIDNIFT